MCTIHQPSSDVFVLFDQVIFMKEGRIFYQGSSSALIDYFNKFGYKCPVNYNPADYVMLLSQTESMETVENAGIMESNRVIGKEIEEVIHGSITDNTGGKSKFTSVDKANFVKVDTMIILNIYIMY